jgi:hypothetical protein
MPVFRGFRWIVVGWKADGPSAPGSQPLQLITALHEGGVAILGNGQSAPLKSGDEGLRLEVLEDRAITFVLK